MQPGSTVLNLPSLVAADTIVQDTLILNSIRDAVIFTDPAGIVTYWNEGAARLFGWSAEEMIGRHYASRYPEPVRAWLLAEVRRCLAGEGWEGEFEDYRKDGSRVWIDARVRRISDADGRLIGTFGISHDISDRKRAEDALLSQNRVLEQIATGAALDTILAEIVRLVEDRLPDSLCSILILDHDQGRLRLGAGQSLPPAYNAAIDGVAIGPSVGSCGTAAYTGQAVVVADIAASPLWANYRDLALSHHLRACWSVPILAGGAEIAARGGRRVLGTFALYRREVGWHGSGPGEVLAMAAHLAGVAIERATTLRGLRESEERFRLLVDGVRDYAVYLTDPAGVVITWNLGAERTYGYCTHEAVGGLVDRFYTAQDVAEGLPAHDLACAAANGRHEAEGWRVCKDGTQFWAGIVITALRHDDGALRGFAMVARDQTSHRRLEEQLRQSQKMEAIGQLAGGVAHDFNNLLTVINGYSEILMHDLPPGDDKQELLSIILEAGEKAARLTGQLLAFSRKAVVEPRVLDLNEAVDMIGKMLRRLIGEDIALIFSLSPEIGWIKIDPGQLEQVILNLAVNARDAMPTGGRLTITTAEVTIAEQDGADDLPAGAYVQLTMTDSGSGMSDVVKARIFEPFFTTKGITKGTGLGLATVYGIIRQAGGRIVVESAPGQGATFHILLPVAQRLASDPHPDLSRGSSRGTETILIVEDEAGVRGLARRTLERQGYTVIEAGSGHAAIFTNESYTGAVDLLIIDVVMPGIGGHSLVEAIRSRRPEVLVLYISGYTDDAVIRHGVAVAPDAFLQKPFTPDGLSRKVRAILDQSKR